MEWFSNLPNNFQTILLGAAGDGLGGIAAELAVALLGTIGRAASKRFREPEPLRALRHALLAALDAALRNWKIPQHEVDANAKMLKEWLCNPAVLSEFRALILPSPGGALNIQLLEAEFHETGLNAQGMGKPSFGFLMKDFLHAFYQAAEQEPALQELLKIELLRQIAEKMGALEEATKEHVGLEHQVLSHLERFAMQGRLGLEGQDEGLTILREIRELLQNTQTQEQSHQRRVYQSVSLALARAGLDSKIENPQSQAENMGSTVETTPLSQAIAQIFESLREIRSRITSPQRVADEDELDSSESQYRQLLVEQFARLTFKGMSVKGNPISLPLDEVYVDLKAVADIPNAADTYGPDERRLLAVETSPQAQDELLAQMDALRLERWRTDARRGSASIQRASISSILKTALVVLGDPGAGKTTLLHYLALCAARGPEGQHGGVPDVLLKVSGGRVLPIFVPLAAYDDHLRRTKENTSLEEFFDIYSARWRSLLGMAPVFKRALEQGRAMILLDGLDEVFDRATRAFVAQQVSGLIQRETRRGNRVIVSSRVIGYREAPLSDELPHVTVLDFGLKEIQLFAQKWCLACETAMTGSLGEVTRQRAESTAKALLRDIQSKPSIMLLAANPLLLTMLALLRRQEGKLPEWRIELYEHYVQTLLVNWELTRSDGARQQALELLDSRTVTNHLMELALWLQRNRPSGTARRQDMETELTAICLRFRHGDQTSPLPQAQIAAQQEADRFLKEMRHISGLLAERGRDAFGFLHLTFQEYFCGRALARMEPCERWAVIRSQLHNPRWHEVILLCAGRLGVIEQRRANARDLVEGILNANSEYEDILHRDLRLACAIATEDIGVPSTTLDNLANRLHALRHSPLSVVRGTVCQYLISFAKIGHENSIQLVFAALEDSSHQHWRTQMLMMVSPLFSLPSCLSIHNAVVSLLDDPNHEFFAVQVLLDHLETDFSLKSTLLDRLNQDGVCSIIWSGLAKYAHEEPAVLERLIANWQSKPPEQPMIVAAGKHLMHIPLFRSGVIDCLTHLNPNIRVAAVGALADLAGKDEQIWHLLKSMFLGFESHERNAVVQRLGSHAGDNSEIRAFLEENLASQDIQLRCSSITGLRSLLPVDGLIRERVIEFASSPQPQLCLTALSALAPLASQYSDLRKLFQERIKAPQIELRNLAVNTLAPLAPNDVQLRKVFLELLNFSPAAPRSALIDTVAPLAKWDKQTEDHLSSLINDMDPTVSSTAIRALGPVLHIGSRHIPILRGLLDDAELRVQTTVIEVLGPLATQSVEIQNWLLDRVLSVNGALSTAAATFLAPLIPTQPKIQNAFINIQQRLSDPAMRQSAFNILRSGVPHDVRIRKTFIELLSDPVLSHSALESLAPMAMEEPFIHTIILDSAQHKTRRFRTRTSLLRPLVASPTVVSILLDRLADSKADPFHGISELIALAPLAQTNAEVHAAVLRYMFSHGAEAFKFGLLLHGPALDAMIELTRTEPALKVTMEEMLKASNATVRATAAMILSQWITAEDGLAMQFLPWLGSVGDSYPDRLAQQLRRQLADAYALRLEGNANLEYKLCEQLDDQSWHLRQGSAWTLIAAPQGPPVGLIPRLRKLIEDTRSEDGWPERVRAAHTLLNSRDPELSKMAIATILRALDYGQEAWFLNPSALDHIRMQAANSLGTLEPIFRSPELTNRVISLLNDSSSNVQSVAYQTLIKLLATDDGIPRPS